MPRAFTGTVVPLLDKRMVLKISADGKTCKVCCIGFDDSVTMKRPSNGGWTNKLLDFLRQQKQLCEEIGMNESDMATVRTSLVQLDAAAGAAVQPTAGVLQHTDAPAGSDAARRSRAQWRLSRLTPYACTAQQSLVDCTNHWNLLLPMLLRRCCSLLACCCSLLLTAAHCCSLLLIAARCWLAVARC